MIDNIITLARKAGDEILQYYHDDVNIERKDDNSPLTKADMAAHRIITEGLEEMTPDIPVISEEGGIAGMDERKGWSRFWLVDPLDGTKEFIKRNGEFTVNIALVEEGIPILGVVYVPAEDIVYTGEQEQGSFKITGNQPGVRIWSDEPDIRTPLRVVVSRSHGTSNLEDRLKEMGIVIGTEVRAGSSLKFCLVAEGEADIYPRFGPTMEWDTAAGDAVFRYSGRKGTRNSPLTYNKPNLKNDEFVIGLGEQS